MKNRVASKKNAKSARAPIKSPPRAPRAAAPATGDASRRIDARIKELGGWRGDTLARIRALITRADPRVVEEWKWDGPVWLGVDATGKTAIICTGEAYKSAVKLTFARGAAIADPAGLFNSSLEGKVRRAIDLHEGDELDEHAFTALIRAALALSSPPKPAPAPRSTPAARPRPRRAV